MYDTILVPTNGSDPADCAERRAVDLAARYDAEVHGLFVAETQGTPITPAYSPEEVVDLFFDDTDHPARSLVERAADRDVPASLETRVGHADEKIIDYANEVDADLIAMGTHGRSGLDHLLFGSTTERTIRRADVPVLCVPNTK